MNISQKRPKKRGFSAPKYMTTEQLDRLFSVIKKPRDLAIMRIAYHRGLRASEIGILQLSDYHVKAGRLAVHRRKGSNSGEYHLTRNERRALDAWLSVRGFHEGPLFPSNRGHGISVQMLDVLIKEYGAAAGLPPDLRHMHALKHSCGTHLLERGEDIAVVQDHLGHANIQNTMIYAKITNRRRDEAGRRLEGW